MSTTQENTPNSANIKGKRETRRHNEPNAHIPLAGGAGNDVLVDALTRGGLKGNDGNDVLVGSGVLEGGRGNDTLVASIALSTNDTYIFNLGDGQDTIIENDLYGRSYEDRLRFGAGINVEQLEFKRVGNDLVINIAPGDQVTVRAWFAGTAQQIETLEFASGITLSSSWINARNLPDTAPAGNVSQLQPGNGNDVIYGRKQSVISGGVGDDYIVSDATHYFIDGGTGNDIINVSGSRVGVIKGGSGDDIIVALDGREVVDGGDGDDQIYVGGADYRYTNKVFGGRGDDVISAFASADIIDGGEGADMIYGGAADDVITDFSGANRLYGEDGNDKIEGVGLLDGGDGHDTLTGTGELYGGEGNDLILGAGFMVGGRGQDTLIASDAESADTYFYARGDGDDTITDYGAAGKGDTLSFGQGIAITSLSLSRSGNDMVFTISGSGAVTVVDWFTNGGDPYDNRIETIQLADGSRWAVDGMALVPAVAASRAGSDAPLSAASQADGLVAAMGSFAAPAAGSAGVAEPTSSPSMLTIAPSTI